MKKLNQLNADELSQLQTAVETALGTVARPTKALVLKVLSDRQHCSPKSTGIEKSLLNMLKAAKISLGPKFAVLMGESAARTASAPANLPATPRSTRIANPTETAAQSATFQLTMVNLKSVSSVAFSAKGGKQSMINFLDGTSKSSGKFGESELRASSNLLDFSS